MEKFNIIYCPDCGLFYMPGINQKTGEEEYTYVESDTAAETYAKKLSDGVYQCADCGTVFELDKNSITNSKPIFGRPRCGLDGLSDKVFLDEFIAAYKVEPTSEQLKAFIDFMTNKTNDVSSFIDIVLNARMNKTQDSNLQQPQK